MKKIGLLCLILALSMMVCSCGLGKSVKSTTTDDTTAASTEKVTDATTADASVATTGETVPDTTLAPTAVQINATLPDGWTKVEGSSLPVQYSKVTASFMAMQETSFPTTDLDKDVDLAKGIFSSTFDNVVYIGEVKTLTIDGNDARQFVFTCDAYGITMEYEYNYVKVGDSLYSVIFADLADTFPNLTADFDAIRSSVTFG